MHGQKLLLIFSLFFFSVSVNAQSFQFVSAGPDTIELDAPSVFDHTEFFGIENISSDTISLSAERVANRMSPGHTTFFCWDLCYDTTQDLSDDPILIPPGDTTRFQYVTFVPDGFNGKSSVTMRFFSADTSLGELERTFYYNVTGGVAASVNNNAFKGSFQIAPNPASDLLFLDLKLDQAVKKAEIDILDLKGSAVLNKNINSFQTESISVKNLSRGLYILVLKLDGKEVRREKLILGD
ncbi:MAG: T9SS type A sorting domain-containing protein [Bacteroidia bacterium]|nr:T9SS type A sorting domain-containing protein [Bacteroidia bacterium]